MGRGKLAEGCMVLALAFMASLPVASAEEEAPQVQQRILDAEAALDAGQGEVAVGIYDELLAMTPDDPELLAQRGSAYCELGQMDKAEADLAKALGIIPDAMHPNYYMGLVKFRQGNFSHAREYLGKALALAKEGSERAAVQDVLGQILFYEGNYKGAEEQFSAAISGQESYQAYSHRAFARMKQGDDKGAEEDFSRLIALYPDDAELYHQRGICRGKQGKYNAALEDFSKAIGMEPENPALYSDRGYTYACKKDFSAAVEDYTKALELDPRYRLAYANRAAAYEKLGKKDLAKRDRELLEKLMEFEENGQE